ncbi:EamA family transporter RarD [Bartonella sp. DGB2]|uniref:EamA family transporter RarD n=1 Tax=Bartonella sp. DGB2 TaxID=3388426 RepID=UPI0039901729
MSDEIVEQACLDGHGGKNDSSAATRMNHYQGLMASFIAYTFWGMFPLYLKIIAYIPSIEVLAYRLIWALPIVFALLILLKRVDGVIAALKKPRLVAMLGLTAFCVSCNWGIYIWTVSHGHTLDGAFGYYIAPLMSVLLGFFFLGEHLSPLQWVGVALATLAVLILAYHIGAVPWMGLLVALTFSIYGFLRKSLPVGAIEGFMIETLLLFIPMFFVAGFFIIKGQDHFIYGTGRDRLLLFLTGPLTAIPFILYAVGSKKLSLSTLGLMQYLSPTCMLLIAVFLFKEPLDIVQFWAFVLIWLGLFFYTLSSLVQGRVTHIRAWGKRKREQ